jgi:hypothetical protein
MSEELALPKHVTHVCYKSRSGEIKEFQVLQPMHPDKRTLSLAELQLLAREIAKVLKEDG